MGNIQFLDILTHPLRKPMGFVDIDVR